MTLGAHRSIVRPAELRLHRSTHTSEKIDVTAVAANDAKSIQPTLTLTGRGGGPDPGRHELAHPRPRP